MEIGSMTLDAALAFLDDFSMHDGHLDGCFNDLDSDGGDFILQLHLSPRMDANDRFVVGEMSELLTLDASSTTGMSRSEHEANDTSTGSPFMSDSLMANDDNDNAEEGTYVEDVNPKSMRTLENKVETLLTRSTTDIMLRRKGSRLSKREELMFHRAQVKKLEATLSALKDAALNRRGILSATADTKNVPPSFRLWEKMAARQLKARREVEHENMRLRAFIESQRRVARNLRRTIRKHAIKQAIEDNLRLRHPKFGLERDAAVFNDLYASLDEVYTRVVKEMDFHNGKRDPTSFGCHNRVRADSRLGDMLEFVDTKMVPFDIRVADKAIWCGTKTASKNPYGKNGRSDTIDRCFLVPYQSNGIDVDIKMSQVTRRYVENDRIIIVINSLIEPTPHIDIPSFRKVSFRERRWVVLTNGESYSFGPTTLIQSHTIIRTLANRVPISLPDGYLDLTRKNWNQSFEKEAGRLDDLMLRFSKVVE